MINYLILIHKRKKKLENRNHLYIMVKKATLKIRSNVGNKLVFKKYVWIFSSSVTESYSCHVMENKFQKPS